MNSTEWARSTDTVATSRRPATRRIVVAAAAGAIVAAAVVAGAIHANVRTGIPATAAANGASLSDAQLATWRGTPKTAGSSTAATAWCGAALADDSSARASVSNVDQRGTVTSMLVSRGGYTSFCLTGGAHDGMWELVNEPGSTLPSVAANAIDLGSEDRHGTTAVNSAWGSAGADVRSVVIRSGGRTITATVDHGFWTAWWLGESVPTALHAVVTTADGSTSTVTLGA